MWTQLAAREVREDDLYSGGQHNQPKIRVLLRGEKGKWIGNRDLGDYQPHSWKAVLKCFPSGFGSKE